MIRNVSVRLRVALAFLVVNAVWGSTFLAIKIGVRDLPPALFAGSRFVLAGAILAVVARLLGQRLGASRSDWLVVVVTAALMVAAGNGLVTWAEQWIASNMAALLITTTALWTTWFGTFGPNGERLTPLKLVGLVFGFAGAAIMFWPADGLSLAHVFAQLAVLLSTLCWSGATMYLRYRGSALDPIAFSAMQMLVGGALLCVVGLAAGELPRVVITRDGVAALIYLALIGSCVAYTTYVYMIRHAAPSTLGTMAYTVPVVATVYGWVLLDEALSPAQLVGMAVIVGAVALIVYANARGR